MRFLFTIARQYVWQTAAMLVALLFAGVAEGLGLTALIPLLGIVLGDPDGALPGSGKKASAAEKVVREALERVGLTPTLELLLLFIFLAILAKCVLTLIANKHVGDTVARLAADLRNQLLKAFLLARWQFHLEHPIGKLANSLGVETTRTAKAFTTGVQMLVSAIHVAITIGVSMLVSWQVTLIAVGVGIGIGYPLSRYVKKAKKAGRRQTKLMKAMTAQLVDSLQSIKPLKAMAREEKAESWLIRKTDRLKQAMKDEVFSKESLKAFQEGLRVTFLLAAIYVAVVAWGMSPSTFLVMVLLLGRILSQFSKVQNEYQQLAIYESAYWSMSETLKAAQDVCEEKLGHQEPTLKNAVRFENVSFSYGGRQVLAGTSLEFPAGRFTAIVGPSGAGKTTIVDLVIGLLRPQGGEVLIDALPLAQVDIQKWRRMIGYVPQEAVLLHDSIFANVALGDPAITESDVTEALRKSGILNFVDSAPEGMHRSVGQRGSMLSGGQRQRIAIARALAHKPRLLILDEATTALDPETEASICRTLRELRGEITILSISHQSAMMEVADLAYRIEHGRIAVVKDEAATSACA